MARQEAWPGFGQRIRQRIRELGYVRPNGSEDISRFTLTKGYIVTLFYKYLSNTTPNRETLLRLAQDLEVSPAWLLFGDEHPAGKAPRRQGRRSAGSLVLALAVGAASALVGWPSAVPRASAQAPTPSVVQVVENIVASQTRRRKLAPSLLIPVLA